jgi:hypothetical protein
MKREVMSLFLVLALDIDFFNNQSSKVLLESFFLMWHKVSNNWILKIQWICLVSSNNKQYPQSSI